MQADLADRLVQHGVSSKCAGVIPDERPGEQAVRFLSVLGGYLALLTAYAGIGRLILH